jgi:hypothetical protein
MKTTEKKERLYTPPAMSVIEIETDSMILAMSGTTPDSDDSEFGAPAQRESKWGDLWGGQE